MDINQLYYFVKIVESNFNLTVAAKRVNISQPALSKFITQFEKSHNIELFVRDNKRYKGLTRAGLIVYDTAKRILNEYNKLIAELDELSQYEGGTINIGIPRLVLSTLFSDSLIKLIEDNPNVKYNIIEKADVLLQKELENGKLDIAFLIMPNTLNSKLFEEHIIYSDKLHIFYSCNNIYLKNKKYVTWSDLDRINFIIPSSDFKVKEIILKMFDQYNVSPNIIHETSSSNVAIQALKNTNAATILPNPISYATNMNGIIKSEIYPAITWQVSIVFPRKESFTKIEINTINFVANEFLNKKIL